MFFVILDTNWSAEVHPNWNWAAFLLIDYRGCLGLVCVVVAKTARTAWMGHGVRAVSEWICCNIRVCLSKLQCCGSGSCDHNISMLCCGSGSLTLIPKWITNILSGAWLSRVPPCSPKMSCMLLFDAFSMALREKRVIMDRRGGGNRGFRSGSACTQS